MDNKGFIIQFDNLPSEWIPEEYLNNEKYWYINNTILPNERIPVSEEFVSKNDNLKIIKNIDSKWGPTEFNIFKTFSLKVSNSEPELEESDKAESDKAESDKAEAESEPDSEPDSEPTPEPKPEPTPEPKPIVKKSKVKFSEPIEKSKQPDLAHVPKIMIPSPECITGESNKERAKEPELFEKIVQQLKKLRNRKLKIEVLIGDLQDCTTQGFAVDAAFYPLQKQIEQIEDFEEDIYNDLQNIIIKCENKINNN